MTAVATQPRRRPRRIAADEAHAWARNLRLGNPYAKLVLSMLTIYVNGEGSCFVGAAALAEDCELALETVRRRLAWLEGIGAIARFPQWLDEHGRRNGDGRGKRTTDDIRLMIHGDPDDIEARANGNGSGDDGPDCTGESAEISPLPEGDTNPVSPPSSPLAAPSLRSSPESLEPEPEKIPPNPPLGGCHAAGDQELKRDIQRFCQDYPAPITNLPRLRVVLQAMHADERKRVILAIKGYAALIRDCERRGKPRAVKDADRWVASGMWQGYVVAGERAQSAALVSNVDPDSVDGKAWLILHRIARAPRPMQSAAGLYLPRPLSPQILALANAPPEDEWDFIEASKQNQCGAWNELIAQWLAGKPRPPLIDDRNTRDGVRGFLAPWPFPPLKDGSIATGPPQSGLSEEDAIEFTK